MVLVGLSSPAGSAQVLDAQLPALPAAPALPVPPPLPQAPVPTPSLPVPSLPQAPVSTPTLPQLPISTVRPTPGSGSPPGATAGQPALESGSAGAVREAERRSAAEGGSGGTAGSPGAGPTRAKRLRGQKLRRLRRVLLDNWTCSDTLSRNQRRALILRAGLFGRTPLPRAAIARRIGVSPRSALRLERSGLNGLRRACGDDALGAAGGTPAYASASSGSVSPELAERQVGGDEGRGGGDAEAGEVLGVFESRGELPRGNAVSSSLSEPDDGLPWKLLSLLAFLVILLALLAAAGLALRRAGVPAGLLARRRRGSQKPLLFLDVDGVITLWPPIQPSPPGRTHDLGGFRVYISGRCAELIQALERRFEIVWATGWEQDANRLLGPILGLERDLPTLRFGDSAYGGTSDWKIPAVERAAGRRPLAWVDDTIGPRHRSWARQRGAPTFLLKTKANGGLTARGVRELLAWADSLEHDGESEGRGSGRYRRPAETAVSRPRTRASHPTRRTPSR
jgi:hypothetical protein